MPSASDRENEDAYALGDGMAVVVDGAGLPKAVRQGCSHSVAWYSHFLADAFARRLSDRRIAMVSALSDAIAEVTAAHSGTCRLAEGSPSATVAAWRLVGDVVEYLVLSDASVVLEFADGTVREVTDDRIESAVSRRAAERLAERGLTGAIDRAKVREARLAALEETRNVEGGFWCCQADPEAASRALVGRVSVTELRSVIAASDGGTRGYQLLGAHTLGRFAALASAGELDEIGAQIRAAETASEPDAIAAIAVKRHDDLTVVVLRFEHEGGC